MYPRFPMAVVFTSPNTRRPARPVVSGWLRGLPPLVVGLGLTLDSPAHAAIMTSCSVEQPPGEDYLAITLRYDTRPDYVTVDTYNRVKDGFGLWISPGPDVPPSNVYWVTFSALIYNTPTQIVVKEQLPYDPAHPERDLTGPGRGYVPFTIEDTVVTFSIPQPLLFTNDEFGWYCAWGIFGAGGSAFSGHVDWVAVPEPEWTGTCLALGCLGFAAYRTRQRSNLSARRRDRMDA